MGSHSLLQGIFRKPRNEAASLKSPASAGGFFTTSATWEVLSLHERLANLGLGFGFVAPRLQVRPEPGWQGGAGWQGQCLSPGEGAEDRFGW